MRFKELIGKKVKILYTASGRDRSVFGILLDEDEDTFKLRFVSGDVVGISKKTFIRISEENGREGV